MMNRVVQLLPLASCVTGAVIAIVCFACCWTGAVIAIFCIWLVKLRRCRRRSAGNQIEGRSCARLAPRPRQRSKRRTRGSRSRRRRGQSYTQASTRLMIGPAAAATIARTNARPVSQNDTFSIAPACLDHRDKLLRPIHGLCRVIALRSTSAYYGFLVLLLEYAQRPLRIA